MKYSSIKNNNPLEELLIKGKHLKDFGKNKQRSRIFSFLTLIILFFNLYVLLMIRIKHKSIYDDFIIFYSDSQFLKSSQPIIQYPKSSIVHISIVMPIFNRLAYINKSITSAQNQTKPNIEIICVDDCSNESVSSFILELMKYDRRIKLVQHMYRQGSFHSRRHGVFTSKGEYIISIDSDDFLYANSIEPVYKYAKQVDADVVDYVAENVKNETNIIHDWLPCKKNFTNNRDLMRNYVKQKLSFNIWKRMVKRSVYINGMNYIYPYAKGKRLSKTEDVLTLGSIFLFANNMFCTKFLVYVHFMSSPLSVERGYLQPYYQNRNQSRYTESVVRYLYIKRYRSPNEASLNDMLRRSKISNYYNNIINIDVKSSKKKCEIIDDVDGFEHFDFPDEGYCVVASK